MQAHPPVLLRPHGRQGSLRPRGRPDVEGADGLRVAQGSRQYKAVAARQWEALQRAGSMLPAPFYCCTVRCSCPHAAAGPRHLTRAAAPAEPDWLPTHGPAAHVPPERHAPHRDDAAAARARHAARHPLVPLAQPVPHQHRPGNRQGCPVSLCRATCSWRAAMQPRSLCCCADRQCFRRRRAARAVLQRHPAAAAAGSCGQGLQPARRLRGAPACSQGRLPLRPALHDLPAAQACGAHFKCAGAVVLRVSCSRLACLWAGHERGMQHASRLQTPD